MDSLPHTSTTNAGPGTPPSRRRISRPTRPPGARKQRGLTCTNCRARKVRCEGSQPSCKTCLAYNDECRYDKPPPMSQILEMARRLKAAERTIATLRGSASPPPPGSPSTPASATASVRTEQVFRHVPLTTEEPRQDGILHLTSGSESTSIAIALRSDAVMPSPPPAAAYSSGSTISTPGAVLPDLSVGRDGEICYYGPTSAIHEPITPEQTQSSVATLNIEAAKLETRALLAAKARETEAWEPFALNIAATQSDIPRVVIAKLLEIHWTWISPMFMWVYRPAFIADMCTGGRYYSEFLLIVMCAHAARFYDVEVAGRLVAKARLLLGTAVHQPSSVPTVQALLQLSARDLAYGSVSQAWLYSGLAFRMAADLGLHHSYKDLTAPGVRGMSPVDLEVRRRLFWSCFFWDTAMSLYTGRMPALADISGPLNIEFYDTTSENTMWTPSSGDVYSFTKLPRGQHPSSKAHYISAFTNSCKLSVIIHDIIVQLYSPRHPATENVAEHIQNRLDVWRAQSPKHLRYDSDFLPEFSPPIFIVSQNHYEACRRAVNSIEKLIALLDNTFGFENITYLIAYCIYTGATVLVQGVRSGDETAETQAHIFTKALRLAGQKCFLLIRSLNIIEQGLKTAKATHREIRPVTNMPELTQPLGSDPPKSPAIPEGQSSMVPGGYLPAFPYLGYTAIDHWGVGTCHDENDGIANTNTAPFSSLDSFFSVPQSMQGSAASWTHMA